MVNIVLILILKLITEIIMNKYPISFKNIYEGVVCSQDPRISVFWTGPLGAPAGTKDSQWLIEPGEIKLYNNSSEPYKNMQNITFICEFDSETNLAPGPGGYNAKQSPGSDPRPLLLKESTEIVPSDKYISYQQRSDFTDGEVLSGTGDGTIFLTSAKLEIWIPFCNYPQDEESELVDEYIIPPERDDPNFSNWVGGSNRDEGFVDKYYKNQILHIKTSGNNQGYYIIKSVSWNGSEFEITIDPTGEYGGLYKENGLSGNILANMPGSKRFEIEYIDGIYYCDGWVDTLGENTDRPGYYYYTKPNNITQQAVDIQTELQENASSYTCEIIINPVGSNLKEYIPLHIFQIVPYWLIESKIDSNDIIPAWKFTLKSIVREIDKLSSRIKNYWENLDGS